MRFGLGSAVVQLKGCEWLSEYTLGNTEHQLLTMKKGGVKAIIMAMKTHESDPLVQQFGCRVLTNLCVLFENKVEVVDAGGAEVTVVAMKRHIENSDIQVCGSLSLMNMMCNEQTEAAVHQAKGVEAVLAAMCAHPCKARVQRSACWALESMVWTSCEMQRRFVACGGEHVVRAALVTFPLDAGIQGKGKQILESLGLW